MNQRGYCLFPNHGGRLLIFRGIKNLLPVPVIPVTLTAATRIEDLFVFNSLNFEAFDNGYYSIKIDFHYRLEFKVREEGAERVITICTVTDITNHYQ